MRKLIYQALTSSLPLVAEIPIVRWIQGGSMDAQIARPFAVYRIVDDIPTTVHSSQPRLQVWIHDNRGSYTRIDRILELVRTTLENAVPMENSTHRIVDVEWTGDSPDLVDEGYDTNTRNASFILTGRK
jgi:hypothetical protein